MKEEKTAAVQSALIAWLAPLRADPPPVYLVGGAVRDLLLKRPVRDIDLMTAEPARLARRLAAVHDAAVVPFLKKADAPCFRVVRRADKDDFMDLVPMHGGSVEADLRRRDFTINAMAVAVLPGGLLSADPIDPLDGWKDLRLRTVRAASPAAFSDDPLRILRAARFAAELNFAVDAGTLDLARRAVPRLANVAAERIVHELLLMLAQPSGAPHIRMLDDIGALALLFPEITPMKGCRQNHYHHLDVWGHSLCALETMETFLAQLTDYFGATAARIEDNLGRNHRLALLKLAALLHDTGKPPTRTVDPTSGKTRFIGHDRQGAALLEEISGRLKLSRSQADYLCLLARNHMDLRNLSRPEVKPATVLAWFRRLGADMVPLLLLSIADKLSARGPAADASTRENHLRWAIKTILAFYDHLQSRLAAAPLIDGHDLKALGLPPGPHMGCILAAVREAQDEARITTREEALALARRLSAPTARRG
jgi:putative nucleotidyltransferase with HDIG domain